MKLEIGFQIGRQLVDQGAERVLQRGERRDDAIEFARGEFEPIGLGDALPIFHENYDSESAQPRVNRRPEQLKKEGEHPRGVMPHPRRGIRTQITAAIAASRSTNAGGSDSERAWRPRKIAGNA